jgi:hypothetical protein
MTSDYQPPLTLQQLAERLGYSYHWLRKKILAGQIPLVPISRQKKDKWRFVAADVEKFLAGQLAAPLKSRRGRPPKRNVYFSED